MKKMRLLVVTVLISMLCLISASAFANSADMDQSNGPSSTFYQIEYSEPIGREFVPSMPILIGVEVYLYVGSPSTGDSTITVNIRPGSITAVPIATQSQVVPSNYPLAPGDWIYFEFTTPVSVTPGTTYVLEVASDTPYHMWSATGDTYSPGRAIQYGNIYSFMDWSFRTYGSSPTPVDIDIKPNSCPNPLNVKSKGVLPVAILGTEDFDVTQIDPSSVALAAFGPGSEPFDPVIPPDEKKTALEDVAAPYKGELVDCLSCWEEGPDGYIDLVLKFDKQEIVAAMGEVEDEDCISLTLTGSLLDGTTFSGSDIVKIIDKGKK